MHMYRRGTRIISYRETRRSYVHAHGTHNALLSVIYLLKYNVKYNAVDDIIIA